MNEMSVNGIKKCAVASVVFGSAFLLVVSPVLARREETTRREESTSTVEVEIERPRPTMSPRLITRLDDAERQASHEAELQRVRDERCTASTNRVRTVVGKYNLNYPANIANYRKMADSARQVIASAKVAGLDTAKAETALNTVETKILTLDEQSKALTAQLVVVQQYVCSSNPSQYAQEMTKARSLGQAAYKTSTELRTYFLKTVRPAIYALARAMKPSSSPAP